MSRWIKHYLTNQKFTELTAEEVKQCAKAAAQGNRDAAKKLIEGHIKLAFDAVVKLTGNADELMSEALFQLTYAVQLITEGKLKDYENVSAYLQKRVNLKTLTYADRLRSVVRQQEDNTTHDSCLKDDVSVRADNTLEVEEQINHLSQDDTDVRIIRMLLLGYNADEIATIIKVHRSCVFRRISRIKEAYKNER